MAKKTKKKQTVKKTRPARKGGPLAHVGVWVGLVLVFLVGFVAYKKIYVPEQEKNQRIVTEQKQFAEGQQAIDALADRVAMQFPPTSRESKNSCDYGSREFDLGPLSCTISTELKYDNLSPNMATDTMVKTSKEIFAGSLKNNSNITQSAEDLSFKQSDSSEQRFSDDIPYKPVKDGTYCGVEYIYKSNIFMYIRSKL
jgi:hypothetical protein